MVMASRDTYNIRLKHFFSKKVVQFFLNSAKKTNDFTIEGQVPRKVSRSLKYKKNSLKMLGIT